MFLILSGCCWKKDHRNFTSLQIPENLLIQKPVPKFTGKTNKDLVLWSSELILLYRQCNADKQSIQNIQEKTK